MKKRTGAALFAVAFLLHLCAPMLFLGAPEAIPVDAAPPWEEMPRIDDPATPKLLALTFDDGPRRSTAIRLLDGLAARGAKATFFLIGKNIGVNRDVVRRMEAEGHQVGIHTYDHKNGLTGLNRADFAAQADKTRSLLVELLGPGSFALRPPYGKVDAGVKAWAGSPIILWSVDPEDWRDQNADREVAYLLAHVKDGDIILMHDIFDATVEAALRTVDALRQRGYYFVTVDELFAMRGIALEDGQVYMEAYP